METFIGTQREEGRGDLYTRAYANKILSMGPTGREGIGDREENAIELAQKALSCQNHESNGHSLVVYNCIYTVWCMHVSLVRDITYENSDLPEVSQPPISVECVSYDDLVQKSQLLNMSLDALCVPVEGNPIPTLVTITSDNYAQKITENCTVYALIFAHGIRVYLVRVIGDDSDRPDVDEQPIQIQCESFDDLMEKSKLSGNMILQNVCIRINGILVTISTDNFTELIKENCTVYALIRTPGRRELGSKFTELSSDPHEELFVWLSLARTGLRHSGRKLVKF